MPYIFKGSGEGLLSDGAIGASGVAGEDELIVVLLGREDLGHVLVGEDPIVHVVAQGVHVEVVAVADFHPDAQGLGRSCWGWRCTMELPCAVGSCGGSTATVG